MFKLLTVISFLFPAFVIAEPVCEFNQWTRYKNTTLLAHKSELTYLFTTSHIGIDADGAPNAYHPDNIGLDYLANAGYPDKSWWKSVLVPDLNNSNKAYKQKSGEFKGFFVSKTTLEDKSKLKTDPNRYVDASNIAYLVFPGAFYKMKGTGLIGDLGYAINLENMERTPFVVADIGPYNAHLGEVSIALAENLGGSNVNPRNAAGAPRGNIMYVIFPYSSRTYKWPLTNGEIENIAQKLMGKVGDIDSVSSCVDAL